MTKQQHQDEVNHPHHKHFTVPQRQRANYCHAIFLAVQNYWSRTNKGTEKCNDSSYEMGISVIQVTAGRGPLSGDKIWNRQIRSTKSHGCNLHPLFFVLHCDTSNSSTQRFYTRTILSFDNACLHGEIQQYLYISITPHVDILPSE